MKGSEVAHGDAWIENEVRRTEEQLEKFTINWNDDDTFNDQTNKEYSKSQQLFPDVKHSLKNRRKREKISFSEKFFIY